MNRAFYSGIGPNFCIVYGVAWESLALHSHPQNMIIDWVGDIETVYPEIPRPVAQTGLPRPSGA